MRIHFLPDDTYLGFTSDDSVISGSSYIEIADDSENAIAIRAGGTPIITDGALISVTAFEPDTTISTLESSLAEAVTFADQQAILAEIELAKRGITKGTISIS